MTDREINSAELEAEKILKDAFAEARAEECPQGAECPVHFRVDDAYFDPSMFYARIITYSGEYAVITEDNHELDNPILALKIMLGRVAVAELPPRWETTIVYVGEGVIADLSELPPGAGRKRVRHAFTHNDWEALQASHDVTVSALEAGLIDVSKPVEG